MNYKIYLVSEEAFFDKKIPSETRTFIENTSRYLRSSNDETIKSAVLSMLLSLFYDKNKYISIFKKYKLELDLDEFSRADYSKTYINSIMKYFMIPNISNENYSVLTPIKIIEYYMSNKYNKMKELFEYYGVKEFEKLHMEVKALAESEEKRLIDEMSNKYFSVSSGEVISYLDIVGKIFYRLQEYDNINVVGISEDSMKALSCFLALFIFNSPNGNLNYKEIITMSFNSCNLSLDNLLNLLLIDLKEIDKINPTLTLYNMFPEYNNKNYTINNIFREQFIDKKERKTVITKLLNAFNIDYSLMNDIYNQFEKMLQNKNMKSRMDYNSQLKPDIISYLESTYKIHSLLMPQTGKPEIDGKIIQSIDDYIPIAFLINSYYSNGILAQFFIDYGITLEDIYKLLGVKIDLSKIDEVTINENSLITNFYRYLELTNSNVELIFKEQLEESVMIYNNTKTKVLNRLFYDKVKQELQLNFTDTVKEHFKEKENKRKCEIIENFFINVDTNVFRYLKDVSCIYNSIITKETNLKNVEVISLLLGTKYLGFYKDKSLYNYLVSIGLSADEITKYLKIGNLSSNSPDTICPECLESHFTNFVFGGYNEGKKREEITIESILANSLNKNLCDSFQITLLLEKLGLDYTSLDNLEEKTMEYNLKKREENAKTQINIIKENCEAYYTCLVEANHAYTVLTNNLETLTINMNENDLKQLSVLIAFLKLEHPYKKYFENHGITLGFILNSINCPINEITSECKEVTNYDLYSKYGKLIENLRRWYEIEYKKDKHDISYIGRRLFDTSIFGSNIIKEIVINKDVYNAIENGIKNEMMVAPKLSVEQILEQLEQQVKNKPQVNVSNIDSILEFVLEGDKGLSKYSEYILLQIKEISKCLDLDESLENIDDMVDEIYVDTPVKQRFLARIFANKNDTKMIQREVNTEVLDRLTEEIDTQNETLAIQIRKYREIFKAISLYLAAIKNYYEVTVEIYNGLLEKRKDIPEDNTSEILNLQQAIEAIFDKKNRYENSTNLMKQHQFQVYQTIVNHFITKSALQASKDDIMPIISSGMLFSMSNISGRNALELSNNLIGLFKNVISQDVNGAKQNLEMLKTSNLPQDTVDKIIEDFSSYINEVDKSREELLQLSTQSSDKETKLTDNNQEKTIDKNQEEISKLSSAATDEEDILIEKPKIKSIGKKD